MPAPAPTVVIGTAGHVDHGKSSLVKALTGTDPDRLAEEKARGLTIDLGFAWVQLPGGQVASFVDVPGHEDFIRNMLAGAGGVSACLLVVAADEGPMPQTHEHLAILDLLGLRHGVVALTKADLVDEDWRDLVTAEVAALLAGTGLAGSAVVPVSATTGAGLSDLVAALVAMANQVPPAPDHGRARLSIDRAFSLAGFGTVVTGTLRDGRLRSGALVELLPAGTRLRARSLHSHGQATEEAGPGTRTAVNLPGVATAAIARGDVLAVLDAYQPTVLLDVALTVLASAPAGIAHDNRLQVFHGAAEVPARVRLVGGRTIAPGESGFAQLRLARPTVVAAGDRLVLRRPSPADTLGGATVLDPRPRGRRRRFRPETLARFAALAAGDACDVAWHMLAERDPCPAELLSEADTGLPAAQRDAALAELAATGRVKALGSWWVTDTRWAQLRERAEAVLGRYHQRQPLRVGAPAEELRERLALAPEAFAVVVAGAAAEGWLTREGDAIRLTQHAVRFGADQQARASELLARFRAAPYAPPSAPEAEAVAGADVVAALVAQGDLVAVANDVLFSRDAYNALVAGVTEHIQAHGSITVAEVRDRFGTSRKYALGLLEHLDRARVTRRVGDARVLARGPRPDAGASA